MLIYEETINSNFDAVAMAVKKASELMARELAIDDSTLFKIDFMLREMLNNAVEHGNGFSKEKYVFLNIERHGNQLKFIIGDQGKGIDLTEMNFNEECQVRLSTRNRGYATVKKLNFNIDIADNRVIVSMNLAQGGKSEKTEK